MGKDTVEGVLGRLAAFKASAAPHEQEVAACMLHNLFDEYRFLAKYPDRELPITARLFGGLVRLGLVAVRRRPPRQGRPHAVKPLSRLLCNLLAVLAPAPIANLGGVCRTVKAKGYGPAERRSAAACVWRRCARCPANVLRLVYAVC